MSRRTKIAVAAATITGLVAPSAVMAVNATHELKVTASPRKAGTKAKPKGTKLRVTLLTTPKDDKAFATSAAIVAFDRNLSFNLSSFPTCSKTTVQQSPQNCPAASKVGSGFAVGKALGQTQDDLKVTAFNGPKQTLQLLVRGSEPLQIDSVIEGKLRNASGVYGKRLVVAIPQNLQTPAPGVFATLTDFTVTINNKSRGGKPYIGIKGCPNRNLKFRSDLTYTDGTSKTATDSVICTK